MSTFILYIQLEGLSAAKICDIIDGEVHENLKELSDGISKAKYTSEVDSDDG